MTYPFMPKWTKRVWPRIQRWWHCLRGTFGEHRMEEVTIPCVWYDLPIWIGCECGKTFWWDLEYWSVRKKKVIKKVPFQAEDYSAGKEDPKALVLVDFKNEQPTDNQTYIDHIYECLAEKVTPQELLILARRLDALGLTRLEEIGEV